MGVSGGGCGFNGVIGSYGWVFGSSLGEVGRCFLDLQDLRWVSALGLIFGMICGVGSNPLRKRFLSCLALLA
jgi:hypothetical protein